MATLTAWESASAIARGADYHRATIGAHLENEMSIRAFAAACALALTLPGAHAQQAEQEGMSLEAFLESLDFRSGAVELPGGIASLDLPEGFLYLPPGDTERVLVEGWGNPPGAGAGTLGMIVPVEEGLFGDKSWAVVVSYEEDGHVKDDDAHSIDYDELLETMQDQTRAGNAQRREAGYPPVELVGWAAPPRYDAATKKLHWAKTLRFEGQEAQTLNYNIRALGRRGVLVLNVIADMDGLYIVERNLPQVLEMTEFSPGYKYADFDPDIDEVAAYGIGALIAGKVAAKAGLFAKLGVLLIALKKFWIVLAIGAFVAVKGLLGRNKATA